MAEMAASGRPRKQTSRPGLWRRAISLSSVGAVLVDLVAGAPMVGSALNQKPDQIAGPRHRNPQLRSGSAPVSKPSRSTTIALTSDETRLVVVNREANTVSVIKVKNSNGGDVSVKLAEIGVGQ